MRQAAAAAQADAERRERSVVDAEERAARHEQVRSDSVSCVLSMRDDRLAT